MKPALLLINLAIFLFNAYSWFDFQITVKYALPLDNLLVDKLIANIDFYFELIVIEFAVYLFFIVFRRFYLGIIQILLLLKSWVVVKFFYRSFLPQAADYAEIFQDQWIY